MSEMQHSNYTVFYLFNLIGYHEYASLASNYNIEIEDCDKIIKSKVWTEFGSDL